MGFRSFRAHVPHQCGSSVTHIDPSVSTSESGRNSCDKVCVTHERLFKLAENRLKRIRKGSEQFPCLSNEIALVVLVVVVAAAGAAAAAE